MMRPTASSASKTLEKAQDKVHDKIHDKAYEKGDAKVAKKVKSAIKGTAKSRGGENAATGEGKKDQHRQQTEEAGTKDSRDAEQEVASTAAKEAEKPPAREEEEIPLVVDEASKIEGGDNDITEDAPPVSDTVLELPEVNPTAVTAE